ncbi:helix-turn-helix domain-containing protein, partial [Arthrobacter woluwensis]|uniref:helix-turn-helix domain-containing protein n=2 Tax=Arthrobacter woluwensis TaxID=156980 RepID=UPI001C3F1876
SGVRFGFLGVAVPVVGFVVVAHSVLLPGMKKAPRKGAWYVLGMVADVPEPWSGLMMSAGFRSMRALAVAAGLSGPTVARLVNGTGTSSAETVNAVASALGVPVQDLPGVGVRDDFGAYVPPAESSRLTLQQRQLIDALIRNMTA